MSIVLRGSERIASSESSQIKKGQPLREFKAKILKQGFDTLDEWKPKEGYLYTVVRAISARVNQNYDGWPSEELKKAAHTFVGKPVFVNHENHDPTKARGVVVAARYVENGNDRYIEVVQEIDANRFPKLAHEIKTGGLDSVSMGAEAGFTICSYCHNKATDLHDMCDHVRNHKGKTLTRFDKRTGKKEDVLVFESCHKISFFELSYVFEPADETAVASKVVVAGKQASSSYGDDEDYDQNPLECGHNDQELLDDGASIHCRECGSIWGPMADEARTGHDGWNPDDHQDPFDPRLFGASVHKTAGECPPGMDCSMRVPGLEQITRTSPNNPVNQKSSDPNGTGGGGGKGGSSTSKFDISQWKSADDYAKAMNGKPYEYGGGGGNGNSVDCSGYMSDLYSIYSGKPTRFTTDSDFAALGFQPGYKPGAFNIGTNGGVGENGHMAGTLPDGTNVESNGSAGVQYGGAAAGAMDKQFNQQWHYPVNNTPTPGVQPATKAAGKYTKEDFAAAGGKKPWETDTPASTRSPVEDDDLKEIEAMIRRATATDDYLKWKEEHGEEADREHAAPPALQNRNLQRWIEQVNRRTAETLTDPLHSQDTTRRNTITTYLASHDLLNGLGAPRGHSLDFGAGWGDSATHPALNAPRARFHTLEPHPNTGMVPDFHDPADIDDGTYKRIHNLNVLNVAERGPRDDIVRHIGRILAPGGHAVITTRGTEVADMLNNPDHAPGPDSDPGSVLVNANKTGKNVRVRFQKGFHPDELHQYVSGLLGDGYTVTKVKVGSAPAAVHIVRNADNVPARPPRPIAAQVKAARAKRTVRSAALRKVAHNRAVKLAWGEQEAPMAVDTLREEGSAPEDDNNDFERYVDPPKDLQTPDLSQAAQIDRQQELAGASPDQLGGQPGPGSMQPPPPGGAPQQQYMTLQIPIPAAQQSGVPMAATPPQSQAPALPPQPQQIAASVLDYFDSYYGRRVANWLDAIEASREFTPAEAADYRRQAARLSTLENGRELSTTDRNPGKEPANMARNTIANRTKVARAGRRQHFAEGPLVDGGDRSRNDQGEQEEAFISQTPPEVSGDFPTDDSNISNSEHNLVARVQQGRAQLLRDAQALASLQQRRALSEAGGPKPTVVDPRVQTGPEGEALTGTHFESADPNEGVVPTNPKDASLRAFQAFDGWLAQKTGSSSRRHSEATIKKAAAQFSREAGISPQALFPALGIVLREARKNDKQANTKGAKMRKRSNESLDVAAPDGRIDVEAPVANTTSAEAQASQFDLHDFGNNAGDNVASPDLSTDQNWAPGEASKKASIKTAGGLLAMRCAEGMIAAGLEPNSRERKYQLAAEFEAMNRGLIQDRVALLERFAAVRQADLRRVASGSSRGAARSPIPAGLGGGTRTASAGMRLAAHDPSNDSSLFI